MTQANQCSAIIKQVNNRINDINDHNGLFTDSIGKTNGVRSRGICFCMDRVWASCKGVSFDKNEVAKSINTAFQDVDLTHLTVTKEELNQFQKNLVTLNEKFKAGNGFEQSLITVIGTVAKHVLQNKKTYQGPTDQGSSLPVASEKPKPKRRHTATRGLMDGPGAARVDMGRPTVVRGVGPTRLRGIPNYSDNCFLISTYQLVKSNPNLYDAIFKTPKFIADKRFDSLRDFDRKYDSGKPLTRNDMELVRKNCLSKFGIPTRGHQDAEEVLTLALFQYVDPQDFMQSSSLLEFVVPPRSLDAVKRTMKDVEFVSQKIRPDGQYDLRVRKQFKKDRAGNILNLPLRNVGSRATFDEVFEVGYRKEGKVSVQDASYKLELSSGAQVEGGQQIERDTVFSAGKSVTVSFKRFEWAGHGNFGGSRKINTKVSIPKGEIQLDKTGIPHVVKGFVVHTGGTKGGHYVQYQKIGKQWYYNNDGSSVTVSTQGALLEMQNAYILQAEKA